MAGVLGIMPETLFSFTFRELVAYSDGVQSVRKKEEFNQWKIAYLLVSRTASKDEKLDWFYDFWSIEGMRKPTQPFKSKAEMLAKKQKLMKAWQIH